MEQPKDHSHPSYCYLVFIVERHLIDHSMLVHEVFHLKLKPNLEEQV